jgi:hypothetical protein
MIKEQEAKDREDCWTFLLSLLPPELAATALTVQDEAVRARIAAHLTQTQTWPAFFTAVQHAVTLFPLDQYSSYQNAREAAVEFLQSIAAEGNQEADPTAVKPSFAKQTQSDHSVDSAEL